MNVQAEVSLYPLQTDEVGNAVTRFIDSLPRTGLAIEVGQMSTRISGETRALFDALGDAFARLVADHQAVLVVKVSNACPSEGTSSQNQDGCPESGQPPSTRKPTRYNR